MTQTLIEKLQELPLYNDRQWIKYDDLRALIDEAPEVEPVALVEHVSERYAFCMVAKGKNLQAGQMLYTSPPPSPDLTKLVRELVEALEKVKPAVVCASDYYYDKPIMTLAIKYNEMLSDIDALITKAREAVKHE